MVGIPLNGWPNPNFSSVSKQNLPSSCSYRSVGRKKLKRGAVNRANSHLRSSINQFNGLWCQSRALDYLVIVLAHTDEILRLLRRTLMMVLETTNRDGSVYVRLSGFKSAVGMGCGKGWATWILLVTGTAKWHLLLSWKISQTLYWLPPLGIYSKRELHEHWMRVGDDGCHFTVYWV